MKFNIFSNKNKIKEEPSDFIKELQGQVKNKKKSLKHYNDMIEKKAKNIEK